MRNLVYRVLETEEAEDESEYQSTLRSAKKLARKRQFDNALTQAKKAIGVDPSNPEAFDFLGQIQETLGDFENARKSYRAAISLDPTYQSAKDNLDRATNNFTNIRPSI